MTTPARTSRSRVKRVLDWSSRLVALVMLLALVLVHNLDHPWVKRRVQALVAKHAGLDVDYGAVSVSLLSGIAIDDLVVRSPPEMRPVAPEFAKVGRIAATWSLGSLRGDGPAITSVTIRDVSVAVTVDEKGRTSLDVLFPPSPEPSTPLSHKASSLLGSGLPVGDVAIERVKLALVKTEHGAEVQRTTLDGVSLEAHAEGTALHARLGDEGAPLELHVERRGIEPAQARAHFWLVADVDATDAALTTSVHVDDQSFAPGARVAQAVRAGARLHFDPKAARTDATIQAEIADGAAHAAGADLSVPDLGPPVVRFATGEIDAARLLAMAPAELVPLTVARAQLRYRVSGLVLDAPPRLEEGGSVAIQGDVSDLAQRLANGSLAVGSVDFDVHATPDAGGMGLHATAKIDGVKLAGASSVDASGLTLGVNGRVSPERAISGNAKLSFATISASGVAARDGNVELALRDLFVDPDDPMAARGDVMLSCDAASMTAPKTAADSVALHAHAILSGHAPYALDADATATRLRLSDASGRTLADAPAKLALKLSDATPNRARLAQSTGTVHATLGFGASTAEVDATKEVDAVGYKMHAEVPSLAIARPFVPPDAGALVPLERMGLKVESTGRVERIASALPEIRHHTTLDLDQPGYASIAAKAIALVIDSKGTAIQHDADIDLRTQALAIAGAGTADDHLIIKAAIDRAAPSAHVDVTAEGRGAIKIALGASFDRARRSLAYDLNASFAKLSPLAPLLASVAGVDGIDVTNLDVSLAAKGDLLGVVEAVGADGSFELAKAPSATAIALGTVDVKVASFVYSHGAVALTVPRVAWHADLGTNGLRRTLDSKLDVGEAHLASGPHVLDVTAVSDHLVASVLGDLRNPDADVTQNIKARTIKQDFAPMYPVGDVSLDWAARRDHRGIVHLDSLRLVNGTGGTSLAASGNLDLSGAQRRLALKGSVDQDLARVSHDGSVLTGSGAAALAVRFESGDLSVFQTRVDATLTNATLRLPARGIVIEGANGVVPINLEIQARPTGAELLRNTQVSPYSMLRFSDQHPLLSRSSFVSIHSITTPWVTIAPLAANLQIDRNIIALEQLEMGIRKGRVTGQCALDWQGEDSTLDLHVRATGVMSSHDEPFDGNAAVLVSVRERSIEGRADVLRIGKRHFLDLLDLVDPTRTDASMNSVRSGLSLGYPQRVHIGLDHGFASAHIELGGLGSLLSIDDIRGIPIGPLVERALRQSKGN